MEIGFIKRRTIVHGNEQLGEQRSEHRRKPEVTPSTSASFFTWNIIQIVLVHSVTGLYFGYNIGLPGPYYTFVEMNFDCSATTSELACTSLRSGQCNWGNGMCGFTDDRCSYLLLEKCSRGVDGYPYQCLWNAKKEVCQRLPGYTAVQNGFFASGLIIGGCIGSMGASSILRLLGRKHTFLFCGLLASFAALLTHIATFTDDFFLIVVGRIIAGIAAGILCVGSPMYVEEMVQGPYRQVVGVFFQIAITLGILFVATVALALNPQDFSLNLQMQQRRQGLCIFSTILSGLVAVTGVFMNENPHWIAQYRHRQGLHEEEISTGSSLIGFMVETGATTTTTTDNRNYSEGQRPSWSNMSRPLFTAFVMCIAHQMTGMSAIMTYAPNITSVMGFAPLTGNFIIMAWNFVAVLISIPVSLRYQADYTYICAVFIISLSCLLIGIPILPALGIGGKLKSSLSATGIAIFIAFFEIGMGSFFWSLSQGIFPLSFRDRGSSFTVLTQFIFNVVVNAGYPIAIEGISGGSSADQEKGMAVVFIFFGCIGLLSAVYLAAFLRLQGV